MSTLSFLNYLHFILPTSDFYLKYGKKHYEKNKEDILKKQKKYRDENRKERNEKQKIYWANHPDKQKRLKKMSENTKKWREKQKIKKLVLKLIWNFI